MVEAKVLAAMAARWFDAAGFNIAFSCLPSDIAREGASASAGFLAAAMELRDLLAQSQQGRQALRDLGFEPAPVQDYPPLPRVGPIGYASVVDIQSYVTRLTIGPHLAGVRDVALWTTDQMRAYVDTDRTARAAQEGK